MNLQQFRFVREACRKQFNLTEAAKSLFTSQPGVSKAIIELEEELGIQIFKRHGKRIRGLTEPGKEVLVLVERIMQNVEDLKRVSRDYSSQDAGTLSIAATHTQARYFLPRIVQEFAKRFPKVRLSILQGSPDQIAHMVLRDQADLAIATESVGSTPGLVSMPCYSWQHSVVAPEGHPILAAKPLTLEAIAAYPLVTYEPAFAGRAKIDQAFRMRGLTPSFALEAIDSDVIKTYVELGLGIGIISSVAFDGERDRALRALHAGHLFGENTTYLALRENSFLRAYVYTFIELVSPSLTRKMVGQVLAGKQVEIAI